MQKCKNADIYQAQRPPQCNGGRPCETCRAKYAAVARAKSRKSERMRMSRSASVE